MNEQMLKVRKNVIRVFKGELTEKDVFHDLLQLVFKEDLYCTFLEEAIEDELKELTKDMEDWGITETLYEYFGGEEFIMVDIDIESLDSFKNYIDTVNGKLHELALKYKVDIKPNYRLFHDTINGKEVAS